MSRILFACSHDCLYFEVGMPLWKTKSTANCIDFYSDLTTKNDEHWQRLAPKAAQLLWPILEMLPGKSTFVRLSVRQDSFTIYTDGRTVKQQKIFPDVMRHVCKVMGTKNIVVLDKWNDITLVERAAKLLASKW